jgi:universal stress protein F
MGFPRASRRPCAGRPAGALQPTRRGRIPQQFSRRDATSALSRNNFRVCSRRPSRVASARVPALEIKRVFAAGFVDRASHCRSLARQQITGELQEEAKVLEKILLPIDLAEPVMTERAMNHAQALAKAFDSTLRLLSVQSLVPVSFLDYVPEDFDINVRKGLERELADIGARLDLAKERVSSVVLFGPVHHTVLAEAEAWGADLIVLCSHRPGMERFLIGSTASAIVRHAKCSVWVVR